ncbi:unnamed protein product [Arctia plantaginis]|uniref:Uncharacterized protein n=2 Tax=Arctia plantaginis TaxID=874455 RepID=A0A8S0ZLM0_ARCPL|nr:unnamed protein product [Arctia plantaginis]
MEVIFSDSLNQDGQQEIIYEKIIEPSNVTNDMEYSFQEPHFEIVTHSAQINVNPEPTTNITQGKHNSIQIVSESLIDMPIVTTTMSTLNTPSVTNLTPVKLSDILVLPKTPQRKGVKNSVKNPFVLTSADWRAKENEKNRIKQEKAEGIKKRKEDRERKKLEKEKAQKMPKKSKKNAKDDVVKFLLSENFYNFNKDATVVEKENEQHIDYTDEGNRQSKRSKTYTTAELEEILTELDG